MFLLNAYNRGHSVVQNNLRIKRIALLKKNKNNLPFECHGWEQATEAVICLVHCHLPFCCGLRSVRLCHQVALGRGCIWFRVFGPSPCMMAPFAPSPGKLLQPSQKGGVRVPHTCPYKDQVYLKLVRVTQKDPKRAGVGDRAVGEPWTPAKGLGKSDI